MYRIPHECDPSICVTCNGSGETWDRDGIITCESCEGKGKTIWRPLEAQEQ